MSRVASKDLDEHAEVRTDAGPSMFVRLTPVCSGVPDTTRLEAARVGSVSGSTLVMPTATERVLTALEVWNACAAGFADLHCAPMTWLDEAVLRGVRVWSLEEIPSACFAPCEGEILTLSVSVADVVELEIPTECDAGNLAVCWRSIEPFSESGQALIMAGCFAVAACSLTSIRSLSEEALRRKRPSVGSARVDGSS